MLTELGVVEDALAKLSNAIGDAWAEMDWKDPSGNMQWADAAVDRALGDMMRIRRWLEG